MGDEEDLWCRSVRHHRSLWRERVSRVAARTKKEEVAPVDVHHACQERHRVLVRLVQGRQNPTKEVAIVQDVQEETTKQVAIACLVRRSALEDLNI